MAQSERGSTAGVGDMGAECSDDVDDSGEPIEPRWQPDPGIGPRC